jgi:hypothetical protein
MDNFVRVKFDNGLIDTNQDPEMKIIEKDGKFLLSISVGIIAKAVDPHTSPSDAEKDHFRDMEVNKNIYSSGEALIGQGVAPKTDPSSSLVFGFHGKIISKVPGTGFSLKLKPMQFDKVKAFIPEKSEEEIAAGN